MSDTPRTDAAWAVVPGKSYDYLEHEANKHEVSCQLERELNEARESRIRLIQDVAEAREQLRLANIDQANTEAALNDARGCLREAVEIADAFRHEDEPPTTEQWERWRKAAGLEEK